MFGGKKAQISNFSETCSATAELIHHWTLVNQWHLNRPMECQSYTITSSDCFFIDNRRQPEHQQKWFTIEKCIQVLSVQDGAAYRKISHWRDKLSASNSTATKAHRFNTTHEYFRMHFSANIEFKSALFNHLKATINLECIQRFISHRAVNTLRLGYKNRSANSI